MGANSIDISQYRCTIGSFVVKSPCNRTKMSSKNKLKTHTVLESFVILSYLLVLSDVTQNLLIISGVELNPGPFDLGKEYLIYMVTFSKNVGLVLLLESSIHIFSSFSIHLRQNTYRQN